MRDVFAKYNLLGLSCLPTQKSKQPVTGLKTWKGGVNSVTQYDGAYGIGIICGSDSGS